MTEQQVDIGKRPARRAEGPWSDLALHSIGWKAFQDLCSQVCEEVLRRPVAIFREAQDGGQDAVFLVPPRTGESAAVASVQCKYSSDPAKRLRVADLTEELEHVKQLVESGQADTYVFITSMGVDAPVAVALRTRLIQLGVRKPHILGKQYLVRTIRGSARLRALVPQVYGLGDLTAILDERSLQQTRAMLLHWSPKLRLYVPTAAHRKAVKALMDHSVVLLLGNPSTGKSAIGAILSTIASEKHSVLNLTGPRDFEAGWNPHEPNRFFWIDDAFGSNVLREEYVHDWTETFRKVQVAISHGNRFLLTSRRHIYEAAKSRLGQRNLPMFIDGRAVVDVGDLSADEKRQILYNHITFGNQTQSWKKLVKPHLEAVSQVPAFLPGIAERLADPSFTKSVRATEAELIRFMNEPREHLVNTIEALDPALRAALILVYVHQGRLISDSLDVKAAETVSELAGVPLPRIRASLPELRGSFLRVTRDDDGRELWGFAHPTIADALTDILKASPHMIAALLRGASVETILGSFVCDGAAPWFMRDAPTIPVELNEVLVERLKNVRDEESSNDLLFRFLADRVSDDVFKGVLEADPEILSRRASSFHRASYNPKVLTHARALQFGMLDEYLQDKTAAMLEEAAAEFDLSFFDEDDILKLIPPKQLLALGIRLRVETLPQAPAQIATVAEEAYIDDEPASNFERFRTGLDALKELPGLDESTGELIEVVRRSMETAIEQLSEKKAAADKPDHAAKWSQMSSVSSAPKPAAPPSRTQSKRSVFQDVDR